MSESKQHYVDHLYGVLQQDCAELISTISNRRRFGHHGRAINNRLNDVLAVVEMLALEDERVYEDLGHQRRTEKLVNDFYQATFEKDFKYSIGMPQYTPATPPDDYETPDDRDSLDGGTI